MATRVKRKDSGEDFDERKVYGSVYAACVNSNYTEKESEEVAEEVTEKVKNVIRGKKNISSKEIRRIVISELDGLDKDLAFFYQQHLPDIKKLQ